MRNEQELLVRQAERELDVLLEDAKGLASRFPGQLGDSLGSSPENVVFEGQLSYVNFRYYTPRGNNPVYKDEDGTARARSLTDGIRAALLRIADLRAVD